MSNLSAHGPLANTTVAPRGVVQCRDNDASTFNKPRRTVQFLPQVWDEHSAHGPGRFLLQAEDEGGCTGAATGNGSPALCPPSPNKQTGAKVSCIISSIQAAERHAGPGSANARGTSDRPVPPPRDDLGVRPPDNLYLILPQGGRIFKSYPGILLNAFWRRWGGLLVPTDNESDDERVMSYVVECDVTGHPSVPLQLAGERRPESQIWDNKTAK
eukprot:scaffold14721_cov120-Isochrysis_galbana.AAC.6